MKSQYATGLSGQAISVYKLLLNGEPLSASDIEVNLKITRQNVYRLTDHLISNGLIDKAEGYPVKYTAKSVNDARNNYLNKQADWFSDIFSNQKPISSFIQDLPEAKPFNISFFLSRDEHLELQITKIKHAKHSIKYIILALPKDIPADLFYELKQAVGRGVDLKILTIEHTEENHNLLLSYKNVGAQVRYSDIMGWHLFLVDEDFSTITVFDPKNKYTQTGVRLVHKGINRELQGIFERYWGEAEPV